MSARVVWVLAAIASMLAPLNPRAANSSMAASRMRARFASGAFGLRMALLTPRRYPVGAPRVLSRIDGPVKFHLKRCHGEGDLRPERSQPEPARQAGAGNLR